MYYTSDCIFQTTTDEWTKLELLYITKELCALAGVLYRNGP